ncbi:MAG: glycosyltransferase family 4 protein [Chloroflexota bacterium]
MSLIRGTVGLVTPRYSPAVGGVEHCVENLAQGLASRGVAVEVITTDPTGSLPSVEERNGILVRRFPTIRRDAVFFLSPKLGTWLMRNAHRYVLIHAHSYHTPLAFQAALACHRQGVAFLITTYYHGTGHSAFRRLLHIPYSPFGTWAVHQARRVICISEAECNLVKARFRPRSPIAITPPGVDVEELLAAEGFDKGSEERLVLSAGRLHDYKQVERIVEAMPYLPADYVLAVVGDGPARSNIRQIAGRLRVDTRLHILGEVPRKTLCAWYRTADLFVTLSRHESFGMTLLEAAVGGATIIASEIPAHKEVARYLAPDVVRFVNPDCSPLELADALQQAAHQRRSSDMKDWSLPTWDGMVDGAVDCYRAALSDARPLKRGMEMLL